MRAVILDLDGVLIHTELTIFETNLKVCRELDIPYTKRDFVFHTFESGLGSAGWLRINGVAERDISKFKAMRDRDLSSLIFECSNLTNETRAFLSKVTKLTSVCIASNTNKKNFARMACANEICYLSDAIVLREDYELPKPSPDCFIEASKKLGIELSESIVVEDSPRGIKAAKSCGAFVIAVPNSQFPKLDTTDADLSVSSLEMARCEISSRLGK